jgi:hypothetical protein
LVFGIKNVYIAQSNTLIMSRELIEFSDLLDEQFDIAEVEEEEYWQSILNMFI